MSQNLWSAAVVIGALRAKSELSVTDLKFRQKYLRPEIESDLKQKISVTRKMIAYSHVDICCYWLLGYVLIKLMLSLSVNNFQSCWDIFWLLI